MKGLFWVLALFAAAVVLTLVGRDESAYVVVIYPPYRVDLSLHLAIAALIVGFVLLYLLVRLASGTLRLPAYVREYRKTRRQEKARTALMAALRALFEGKHAASEKAAVKALELGQSPGLTACVAARAAHELRAYDRRDDYLRRAENLAPDEELARLMTEASLLVDQRRSQEAIAILRQIHERAPKHVAALRLELRAQQQAKNWDQVLALLTQLEKRKGIEASQAEQLRVAAYTESLRRKAADPEALKEYWGKLPASYRLQPKLAAVAARGLIASGDHALAQEIIEKALDREWDSELARIYGSCVGQDGVKQIQLAEKWLTHHSRDADLLLTLGMLCSRQELWGKAQSYLEASLAIQPSSDAHIALARLLEKMNKVDEACHHYRQSLELSLASR